MLTRRALLSALAASTACSRGAGAGVGAGSVEGGAGDPALAAAPPGLPVSRVAAAPPPPASPASPASSAQAGPGEPPARPPALPVIPEVRKLDFGPSEGGPQAAVILVPTWGGSGEKYPLLVTLHGLGEARKGVEGGAWGWVRDYWLDKAMARLRQPPITREDMQGFFDPRRLDKLNASLVERPFRGLVVACPYTPDLLAERSLDNAGPYGKFITARLLPRLAAEAPLLPGRDASGIDGVSLGGRLALLVGLAHTARFSAIGSLQAAVQVAEARRLARRARRAFAENKTRLRLLTSEKDFYRDEIRALHNELTREGVSHEHLVVPGPHDYPFNRGPGAIEMLVWHDRVLRGEDPL